MKVCDFSPLFGCIAETVYTVDTETLLLYGQLNYRYVIADAMTLSDL